MNTHMWKVLKQIQVQDQCSGAAEHPILIAVKALKLTLSGCEGRSMSGPRNSPYPEGKDDLHHYDCTVKSAAGDTYLRWNSWTTFSVEASGDKLESSQTRVFVWFSTIVYPFYESYSWIDLSFLVSRIFGRVLKPKKSVVFFKIRH